MKRSASPLLNRKDSLSDETPPEKSLCVTDTVALDVKTMKRRQYAMLMMYSGWDYYGYIRQPKLPTIEENLLDALLKAELITEENRQTPGQIRFQVASKTDRRVSAIGQVVSARLNEAVENPVQVMNSFLPTDIKIIDIIRVTQGFNAREKCCHREYQYVMPSFVLAHKDCPDEKRMSFRASSEDIENFTNVLERFKGTHNFFHFTSRINSKSPSCNRYIINLECSQPLLYNCDLEYVVVTVVGQSFMMHQIRKMIGLAIAVISGHIDITFFEECFKADTNVHIPRAPGLGLFLDKVIYNYYNKMFGKDHISIDWSRYNDEREKFKKENVFKKIMQEELDNKSMLSWLDKLKFHAFYESDEESPPCSPGVNE